VVAAGADAACAELLAEVERASGRRSDRPDLHPVEQAGRLVAEDLCVHLPDASGVPVLVAACLCFPFRWVLAEKLGRPLSAIHAPIPGFAEQLGTPVDRLVTRLTSERGVVRHNVGMLDCPDLFQPRRPDQGRPPVPDGFFVRSERQTLRRLPTTYAVVFTIRTTVLPVRDLDADGRARMADWLRGQSPELLAYRELTDDRDRLLEWLDG
jgi:hypothetical protein